MVLCPHPPGGSHVHSLLVHSHVNHQLEVGLERLLTHQTVFPISGNSRDLVHDLCDFLAWAPSDKSSPQRRATTCCLTCFKALFFTTNSSSAIGGSSGTGTGAGPPNMWLPWVRQLHLHLTAQQPHHLQCHYDGPPST